MLGGWGTHFVFHAQIYVLLPIFLICRCSGQFAHTNLFRDSEINDQTNPLVTLRFGMFDFHMIRTCDFIENKHLLFSHTRLAKFLGRLCFSPYKLGTLIQTCPFTLISTISPTSLYYTIVQYYYR